MVQVSSYDNNGTSAGSASTRPSREVLASEVRALDASLQALHRTASTPSPEMALLKVPNELVQYVEKGRNPDIYTREFVELARRRNQFLCGKQNAFASFRDVLASQMDQAMPELREDTERVVVATGGDPRSRPAA